MNTIQSDWMNQLRQNAEAALRFREQDHERVSKQQIDQLLSDIQVYQVELEIQNEELRRAQKDLERSRNRFAQLYEQAPVGYIVLDKVGMIVNVNRTFCEMLKVDRSDTIERPFVRFIDPSDRSLFLSRFRAFFKNPEGKSIEIRLIPENGSRLYASVEGRFLDSEGAIKGLVIEQILLIITDITERRKAEVDLRDSEQMFRTVFEQSAVGIAQVMPDGRFVMVNTRFSEMVGYTKDELSAMTFKDLTHPDDLHMDEELIMEVLTGAIDAFEVEKRYIHKNGDIIWIKLYSNVVRNTDGGIRYAIATVVDITRKKKADRNLLESEEKFRTLVDHAGDMLIVHDMEGNIVDVNAASINKYGYSREALLKMTVADLDPDYNDREDAGRFWKNFEPGQPIQFEARQRSRDGTIFPVEVTVSKIRVNHQDWIMGMCRDISAQKADRERIRSQHRFLQSLLDAIPISVFYKDSRGVYIGCNNAFADFLGKSKNHLIGKDVYDIFPEDFADRFHEMDSELLRNRPGMQQYEAQVQHADGTMHDVLFSKAVYDDDAGNVAGLIGTMIDITDRKKTQRHLQHAQKMESIGNLAGGIAHDFNNLLFPIVGMSEMLKDDLPSGSQQHQFAQDILDAALRGADLVKRILTFSRRAEPKRMPVSIPSILKDALRLVRATIPSNIAIQRDIMEECGTANADPTQLHQIVINLLTNAYHAVEPNGGVITVTLSETQIDENPAGLRAGRYALLSVSDNGCGIEPTNVDKIFDPYFTTKNQEKGTGLGLSVVYGIVREHDGDIRIESEVGKGSRFDVYLPLAEKTALSRPHQGIDARQTKRKRILLVDDEKPITSLLSLLLERMGHQVTTSTDALEALNTFKADPDAFDLVITDMSMPDMTGTRLSREIISLKPDIPIILCTGFSELIDKEKVRLAGIRGFLMKPVVKSELVALIHKVMEGHDSGSP